MKDLSSDPAASIAEADGYMMIAFADEMTGAMMEEIAGHIMEKAAAGKCKGAIFNFSMVRFMDSHTFNVYKNITKTLALMGVKSVWAGLNPCVVCSLLDLDIGIDDWPVMTATGIEQGLALLRSMK